MGVSRRSFLRGAGAGAAAAAVGAGAAAAVTLPDAASKTAEAGTDAEAVRSTQDTEPDELETDVLVVGAGAGGMGAAIALLRAGRTVILTDPTSWVGGQLTSQGVPVDDHAWVDQGLGATRIYRELREDVRAHFKLYYPLTAEAKAQNQLDPGNGWAHLSAEPSIWHQALRAAVAPYEATERVRLLLEAEPVAATMRDGRVRAVRFRQPDREVIVRPQYVVEASELGDLLPLAGIPHVVGREKGGARSQGGTGELHNHWEDADPACQQAFTVVAALGYSRERSAQPVTSSAYRKHLERYESFGTNGRDIFDPTQDWSWADAVNFWQYRRVRFSGHLTDPKLGEITMLNQPQNDHAEHLLVPPSGPNDAETFRAAVAAGTAQTLGLIQYFQTEYRRPGADEDGVGGLFPVPWAAGTESGIAAYPYVRESRRIQALQTVFEWHVGVEDRLRAEPNARGAQQFADSVGIGAGPVDIHDTSAYPHGVFFDAYPFQIPMRSLIPQHTSNVLAGGKTLGCTHVTNGTYRYHPNEWGIGEAAGHALAFVLNRKLNLRDLLDEGPHWQEFADYLERQGVRRSWPRDLRGVEVARLGG